MSTTVEVLEQARALIEDESRWCQRAHAKRASGLATSALATDACQWCAEGALARAGASGSVWCLVSECATEIAGSLTIAEVNDTTDHATVLRMFDCAIAKARGGSDG